MKNPLLDKNFLIELDQYHEKEVWAKIIALDINEQPQEEITGQVSSGGSINIDGSSAVRRSVSLTMIAKDVNINSFYWGLHTKIKLFVGLTNKINSKYPDIIWFPQGTYVLTSFNTSQSTNSFNISLQGKDKMCLLNGEIGGSLTAPIDFGKLEERDEEGNLTITDIPIKEIIKEAVHEYAKEPWHNIIINDLDDLGIELLEYRGTRPLYMLINESTGEVTNMTMNEDFDKLYKEEHAIDENNNKIYQTITVDGKEKQIPVYTYTLVKIKDVILNKLTEFYPGFDTGYFVGYFTNSPRNEKGELIEPGYSVAKIEYGQTAGYRLTDITYPGDLIANQGDSLTSVLDKLVQMLGQFEYFYDLDGRFVFQKKKTYVQTTWNNLIVTEDEETIADIDATPYGYEFKGNDLTISFSNNPNLTNLKNDFSIWGTRTSVTGAEIPVHLRYAIDHKPFYYKAFSISEDEANEYNKIFQPIKDLQPREEKVYTSEEWDWRELIYQMAKDYRKFNHWDKFLVKVRDANFINGEYLYPTGYTGYEQYYIDLEGFWRQLYNPNYLIDDKKLNLGGDGPIESEIEINEFGLFNGFNPEDVYIYPFKYINNKFAVQVDEDGKEIQDDNKKKILLHSPEQTWVIFDNKDFDHKTIDLFINQIKLKDEKKELKYYIKYSGGKVPTEVKFEIAEKASIASILIELTDVILQELEDAINDKDGLFPTPEELFNYYEEKYNRNIVCYDKYIRYVDYKFLTNNEDKLIYKSTDSVKLTELKLQEHNVPFELYYNEKNECYWPSVFIPKESVINENDTVYYFEQEKIKYYYTTYNYIEPEKDDKGNILNRDKMYWHKNVWDSPQSLNFWFDFMDSQGEINKYSVSAVGNRPKVVNDSTIKAIYFRETPTVIFINKSNIPGWKFTERKSGYTYIQLPDSMLSLFKMSGQGKSAWNMLEESMQNETYCVESASITTIPIYYLQPNTKIYIRDENSKIDGEYIVSRFTIPLNYNGTMSISATKIADRIY